MSDDIPALVAWLRDYREWPTIAMIDKAADALERLDAQLKAVYCCKTCGNYSRNAYVMCNHPVCPDGRDQ